MKLILATASTLMMCMFFLFISGTSVFADAAEGSFAESPPSAAYAITTSLQMDNVSGLPKGDMRSRLSLHGVTPTLVILMHLAQDTNGNYMEQTTLEAKLKEYDNFAKEISDKGFDTLVLYKGGWTDPLGVPKFIKQAGLKHAATARVRRFVNGLDKVQDPLFSEHINTAVTASISTWFVVGAPGSATLRGRGLDDKKLTAFIDEQGKKFQAMEKRVAQSWWKIGRYELSAAYKVASKMDPDDPAIDLLTTKAKEAESHFRQTMVKPFQDKGYLVQAAKGLETLSGMLKGSDRGKEVTEEYKTLTKSKEYKDAKKAGTAYEEVRSAFDLAPFSADLKSGTSAAGYYAKQIEAWDVARKAIEAFLQKHDKSIYAKEVGEWKSIVSEQIGKLEQSLEGTKKSGR